MPHQDHINTFDAQSSHVSDAASKAASSFIMLELHLKSPSQKLDLGYDYLIGGIWPMHDYHLPLIHELSTATDFNNGVFRTNDNSYFIFREDIDTRITSFDAEVTLLEFWEPSAFRTPEQTLSFLRSMKSNLIDDVDPNTLTSHFNMLRIIAQATTEIVLARYAQLKGRIDENVPIYLSAKSKLDQSIEIELGSNGDQPTGVHIPADTLIISNGYNDVITGPYVRVDQCLRVPTLAMANIYFQSAQQTFSKLGLDDLSKLISEIDESFENY